MSLYGLDESIRELLQLEYFEKDFSSTEFIENLSENHEGTGALSEALDPKPYIRTFEAALGELKRLQDIASKNEASASSEAERAELEHSRNVVGLGDSVEHTMSEFGVLDGLIGDIGAATSGLSDKLERLSLQHELASSSAFLINCYLAFSRENKCPELERLWEGSTMSRRRVANVIRQLQTLSKRLEGVGGNRKAQDSIDVFANKLENDLLQEFNHAYSTADLVMMKESADILTDFNGGGSVVQSFVNQHDFFIEINQLNTSGEEYNDLWAKLSDPKNDTSEFEEMLQAITDEIRSVADTETEIIRKVFRDPAVVLKPFIQRIFAQRIQDRLEGYLMASENISLFSYVRVLHVSYNKVGGLVKNLKEAFVQADVDKEGELASILDQNFADIFVPYIEDDRYFDYEKKSLQDVIDSITFRFRDYHSHRKLTREQSLLGRFTSSLDKDSPTSGGENVNGQKKESNRIGQIMGFVNRRTGNTNQNGGSSPVQATHPSSFSNSTSNSLSASNASPSGAGTRTSTSIDYDESDGELKFEDLHAALKMAAESVNRGLELVASPSDNAKDGSAILAILLDTLGKKYIDVVLDDALQASQQDFKSEVGLVYLKTISKTNGAIQLLASFVKTVLLQTVSSSSSTQKSMATSLNQYITSAETKTNQILQQSIDLVLSKVTFILSKQKKKDFVPNAGSSNDGSHSRASTPQLPTETQACRDIVSFMQSFYENIQESLDGANLNTVLIEVGIGLRDLVMEHIKKFNINAPGALILARDIQMYQEVVDSWSISELSESYSILHAIANLYTAQPQAIPSLLKESMVSQLKPYVIREYLSRRVDYYSSQISKIVTLGGFFSGTAAPAVTAPTTESQVYVKYYPMMMPHV
ncbi:exocyst complex component Sec10p [Trichomonascus vanleenenianus]|uniref:exocyst subunit SEC10 n=1 Tax=Trichomonascus vanleenenianus TaxID=2268995 RepID=UPI003ECB253F